MDNVTLPQLEKYKELLNEIENEYVKHENLKKELKLESKKLAVVRITMEKSFVKDNFFRVLVKVFSSIFELNYIYSNDLPKFEFDTLCNSSDCKFYAVDVYISKQFQQKILNFDWLLNVCVKNSRMIVSKNAILKRENLDRVVLVVPFDSSLDESVVEVYLFHNFYHSICISKTIVDISYHFTSHKTLQLDKNIQIAQNYYNIKDLLKCSTMEYNFQCRCSSKHFLESIIKNCYHLLNDDLLTTISTENNIATTILFYIQNENEIRIKLDETANSLTIICDVCNLAKIKKYFIDEIQCRNFPIKKIWMNRLRNLKGCLRSELAEIVLNLDNLKEIYQELQKLVVELTV